MHMYLLVQLVEVAVAVFDGPPVRPVGHLDDVHLDIHSTVTGCSSASEIINIILIYSKKLLIMTCFIFMIMGCC